MTAYSPKIIYRNGGAYPMPHEHIEAIYVLVTIIFLVLFLTSLNKAITFWHDVEDVQRTEAEAMYRIQEYSKYADYDNTTLSGAEVVAAILKYKDVPNFVIKHDYISYTSTDYEALNNGSNQMVGIDLTAKYISNLEWSDDSSYVKGINFIKEAN